MSGPFSQLATDFTIGGATFATNATRCIKRSRAGFISLLKVYTEEMSIIKFAGLRLRVMGRLYG